MRGDEGCFRHSGAAQPQTFAVLADEGFRPAGDAWGTLRTAGWARLATAGAANAVAAPAAAAAAPSSKASSLRASASRLASLSAPSRPPPLPPVQAQAQASTLASPLRLAALSQPQPLAHHTADEARGGEAVAPGESSSSSPEPPRSSAATPVSEPKPLTPEGADSRAQQLHDAAAAVDAAAAKEATKARKAQWAGFQQRHAEHLAQMASKRKDEEEREEKARKKGAKAKAKARKDAAKMSKEQEANRQSRPDLEVAAGMAKRRAPDAAGALLSSQVWGGAGSAGGASVTCEAKATSAPKTDGSSKSLQARLRPSNMEAARAKFMADPSVDPIFEYANPVEAHELERFPCDLRHLSVAVRILEAVVVQRGKEKGGKKAREPVLGPEELVSSAERFLASCAGPHGASLPVRLNVHFLPEGTRGRAISIRGNTMNVPLPCTLSETKLQAVWYHELGTHWLRNAINEPIRRVHTGFARAVTPGGVPVGASTGLDDHMLRLKWARENPMNVSMPRSMRAKRKKSFDAGKCVELPTVGGDCGCDDGGDGSGSGRPVSARDVPRSGTEREAAQLREAQEHVSEEGLAVVNQYIAEKQKGMWRPALMYWAAAKGSTMGFAQLYAALKEYVADDTRRWGICARVKGGLVDTSASKSFCRDQLYLVGAIMLLKQRRTVDLRALHCGRICIDEPATFPSVEERPYTLPPFLEDMEAYRASLDVIAKANFVT